VGGEKRHLEHKTGAHVANVAGMYLAEHIKNRSKARGRFANDAGGRRRRGSKRTRKRKGAESQKR